MKRFVAMLVGLILVSQVQAYGTVNAKVLSVRVDQSGQGMVVFDQPVVGEPASCRHSAYTNALAFDANTAGGKAILATALAAKASGDTLAVHGTGTCVIYSGWVEDWSYGLTQ